ncbi:hypothetical protein BC940DRAFT_313888 [Gongronella butleri]|nr:hypothetical protein BC940DRAFT_313888 [Gongronella butleri]
MTFIDHSFLLHAFVEGTFGLLLLLRPQAIDFVTIDDATTRFLAQGWGAALLGAAVTAILVYGLPNMLPCKRAAALGFIVYHGLCAIIAFQARLDGPIEPHMAWGISIFHLALMTPLYLWYKVTGEQVHQFIKKSKKEAKDGGRAVGSH